MPRESERNFHFQQCSGYAYTRSKAIGDTARSDRALELRDRRRAADAVGDLLWRACIQRRPCPRGVCNAMADARYSLQGAALCVASGQRRIPVHAVVTDGAALAAHSYLSEHER